MTENRCKATTKNGNPCRAAATAGGLCFFHANPNKASELGRVGGRKNRRGAASPGPLPDLNTAKSVRDTVTRFIQDVYSGELDRRVASGLAPLLKLQLTAIGTSVFEARIDEIEETLANILRKQRPTDANNQKPFESANSVTNASSTETMKPEGS